MLRRSPDIGVMETDRRTESMFAPHHLARKRGGQGDRRGAWELPRSSSRQRDVFSKTDSFFVPDAQAVFVSFQRRFDLGVGCDQPLSTAAVRQTGKTAQPGGSASRHLGDVARHRGFIGEVVVSQPDWRLERFSAA